jgi:Na+-driven multidrug efflux pump
MDLAKDNVSHLYRHFLFSAFGAALVGSIFSMVDMAMMGHYQGPDADAALAIISPLWNIIYALGLLTGIGASVLYAELRGKESKEVDPNAYFTVGLILTLAIGVLEAILLNVFLVPVLNFFGADQTTLPLCLDYLKWIRYGFPLFTLSNFLAGFLRNDKAPGLATAGIIAPGLFNVLFDYIFIYACGMGMEGAGLATILGMLLGDIIMVGHFFGKKNTLKWVRFDHPFQKSWAIIVSGFSSFFTDAAMGIANVAFNRHIIALYPEKSSAYLSIYGVLVSLFVFVQCASYGIGQASQPLISYNHGACLYERVKSILRHALFTCLGVTLVAFIVTESIPVPLIRLFMTPSDDVLALAPLTMRPFALCFLALSFNVVACYYFQAILKSRMAFVVSLLRGALLPLLLLYTLTLAGASWLWYVMPFTEFITAFLSLYLMIRYTKNLGKTKSVLAK